MFGYRPDGKKVKDLDPISKIVPHIMSARHDALNSTTYNIDCSGFDAFIHKQAEQGLQYNYMHILIAAMVRGLALYPALNRFVMNGRIYEHNHIQISFVVKKSLDLDAPESLVKITCSGKETIAEIREKINAAIEEDARPDANNGTEKIARVLTFTPNFMIKFLVGLIKFMDKHSMLPMAILNLSPFHTSAFVTNLKSIKGPSIYHHLYDFGTTGIFFAMGKESVTPIVRGGEIVKGKTLPLKIVMDERFADGFYWVCGLRQLVHFLQNPSLLEAPLKDQSANP